MNYRARVVGFMPTAHDPKDYAINRARRGELPDELSLHWLAILAVAGDKPDSDLDAINAAERTLYSLMAGGLLIGRVGPEGKAVFTRRAVVAVEGHLRTAGLWGEGLALWRGSGGERVTREEAQRRGADLGYCEPGSDSLSKNPKWTEPFKKKDDTGAVSYEWDGLEEAWKAQAKGTKKGESKPVLKAVAQHVNRA